LDILANNTGFSSGSDQVSTILGILILFAFIVSFLRPHSRPLFYGLLGGAAATVQEPFRGMLLLSIFIYGLPDGTLIMDTKEARKLEEKPWKERAHSFFAQSKKLINPTISYPLAALLLKLLLQEIQALL